MNALDLLVFLAAGVSMIGYICRLAALHPSTHRPWIIVLHMALAVCCIGAGGRACGGDAGLLEAASVVGALAWLIVSFPTWRNGVPEQFRSRPMELDDEDLQGVRGGSGAER